MERFRLSSKRFLDSDVPTAVGTPRRLVDGFFLNPTTHMPTYTYRREDGTTFEIRQRITEDPLDTCPETGQDVERIITGNGGVIFKGDGFHVNDYDRYGPADGDNGDEG